MKKHKQIFLFLIAAFCNSVFAPRHFVLYRGVHNSIGNNLVNSTNAGYDGNSLLVHHALQNNLACNFDINNLMALRDTGPIKVHVKGGKRIVTEYKGEQLLKSNQRVYASVYDWIFEYYIQHYDEFARDLRDDDSHLRKYLKQFSLDDLDKIFLVSTSFNPYKALRYASGLNIADQYRTKPFDDKMNFVNSFLGYVDVFVIPFEEMKKLMPYFALEAFATHKSTMNNGVCGPYHEQEEVIIPFSIPGKFHVKRVPFTVQKSNFRILNGEKKKSKPETLNDDQLVKKLQPFENLLLAFAQNYIQARNLQRAFSYDLIPHFRNTDYYLAPSEAQSFYKKICELEDYVLLLDQAPFVVKKHIYNNERNEEGQERFDAIKAAISQRLQKTNLGPNNPVIAGFDECADKFEIMVKGKELDFSAAYALYNLSQRMPISAKFKLNFHKNFDLLLPVVSGHGIFQAHVSGGMNMDVEYFSINNRRFNSVKHRLYELRIDEEFLKNIFATQCAKNLIKEKKGKYSKFSKEDKDQLDQNIKSKIESYKKDGVQISYNPSDDLLMDILEKIHERKHPIELSFDLFLPANEYFGLRYSSDNLQFFCANDVVYKKLYSSWSIAKEAAKTNLAQQRRANSAIFS